MIRRRLTAVMLSAALATGLAACGTDDATDDTDDAATTAPADGATDGDDTVTDDTSMPADEDVQERPTSVTEGEAEAVGNAYLGLTLDEAEEQGVIDGRTVRVARVDGEEFALTEDYVVGRITLELEDDVVVSATVEATDGPVTVGG